jgi:hypothetical protein
MQRKREKQGQPVEEASREPSKGFAQWDYLMFEAQWMFKDMAQERLWKKKAAFYFANVIAAASPFKLRPVPLDAVIKTEPQDDAELSQPSRRTSRSRCASCH